MRHRQMRAADVVSVKRLQLNELAVEQKQSVSETVQDFGRSVREGRQRYFWSDLGRWKVTLSDAVPKTAVSGPNFRP
jgi:hypothetical protein